MSLLTKWREHAKAAKEAHHTRLSISSKHVVPTLKSNTSIAPATHLPSLPAAVLAPSTSTAGTSKHPDVSGSPAKEKTKRISSEVLEQFEAEESHLLSLLLEGSADRSVLSDCECNREGHLCTTRCYDCLSYRTS